MGQLHRFYAPDLATQPDRVQLADDERHHALRVVRVRAGQLIQLFDGTGHWCNAEVLAAGRRDLEITRGELKTDLAREPLLTLAPAWLNHERSIESIVQRGTALGVDRFVFFRAHHSERGPRGKEKWARWAIESCKQCGRNRLPEFAAVDDLVSAMSVALDSRYLIATQHATPVPVSSAVGVGERVLLMIGPEGDFAREEVEAVLERGGQPIALGPYTLRAEVAAAAAVTLVQHALGRFGP